MNAGETEPPVMLMNLTLLDQEGVVVTPPSCLHGSILGELPSTWHPTPLPSGSLYSHAKHLHHNLSITLPYVTPTVCAAADRFKI
jgi:hypothetical protein